MTAGHSERERALAAAFVGLADTLVDSYDVIELLHQLSTDCVELLPVDAAGLVLSDQRGHLSIASYSTEAAFRMEQFQLERDEGPCVDCFRTSRQVTVADLADDGRWPGFAEHAMAAGYQAVHAIPLRLRAETIGALNLFGADPRPLTAHDMRIGQALADVATIGILQERTVRRREILAEQLETALNSRVIIEQAKGVIAEFGGVTVTEAFDLLRGHARSTNQKLTTLARAVVDGTAVIDDVLQRRRNRT